MSAKRTLVTGAGGFIGGRVVEAMVQLGDWEPVPGIRRWASAARIGRHRVEPVLCDVRDPAALHNVMQGVDSVVHCAIGGPDVTVDGTRNVMAAALEKAVRRVVHLSTIDVYGRAEGTIPETAPLVRTGREYGDAKIAAEHICMEFVAKGLDVVILRPTIVYGPFSPWTVEPAQRLSTQSWLLPRESCQGICNLVYVDDLVRAVLLAIETEGVSGMAFNINGPDRPTWQEYVEEINSALGLPQLTPAAPGSSKARTVLIDPVRQLVKKVFYQFEDQIMTIYRSSKHARRLMKWVEGSLAKVPSHAEYDLYGRRADFPTALAETELGYHPRVSMKQGVSLSAAWLVHEGVVDKGA